MTVNCINCKISLINERWIWWSSESGGREPTQPNPNPYAGWVVASPTELTTSNIDPSYQRQSRCLKHVTILAVSYISIGISGSRASFSTPSASYAKECVVAVVEEEAGQDKAVEVAAKKSA